MIVRAITVHQPWATLLALGIKRFETRDWDTRHRGPLVIHAGKRITEDGEMAFSWLQRRGIDIGVERLGDLPLGAVVGLAELTYCYATEFLLDSGRHVLAAQAKDPSLEVTLGDFSRGRFAWLLASPRPLRTPIPYRGQQQLWYPSQALYEALVLDAMDESGELQVQQQRTPAGSTFTITTREARA